MPRNGSGIYNLPTPQNPVIGATLISSANHNTTMLDVAAALSASISNDGQTTVYANIPLNNHKFTGLSAATSAGEAIELSQLHAATDKASPIDADEIPLLDSAATFGLKKATLANLKTVISATITFLQAGTGAVARTIQAVLRDQIRVMDYGAVGDGVADDTAAINAALTQMAATKHGVLIFAPGDYRITSTITLPTDGITIQGTGYGQSLLGSPHPSTRIIADFSTGYAITINKACCGIKDMEVTSSAARWAAASANTNGGIRIDNANQTTLSRVQVFKQNGIGIYVSRGSASSVFNQVTVEYAKSHAFVVDNGVMAGIASEDRVPCGIITFDTCRADRVDGMAFLAGDPAVTTLTAFRLYLLNFECFYCGGSTALGADYIIKLYAQNCSIVGAAIGGPQGQLGGSNTTIGTDTSGAPAGQLVRGVYVSNSNNRIENLRCIQTYQYGVTLAAASKNTYIVGVEGRHLGAYPADDYTSLINIESGATSFYISGVGEDNITNASNLTTAKIQLTDSVSYINTDRAVTSISGVYTDLNSSTSSFSVFVGSTQEFRVGTDTRSLGDVRPITNNISSVGVAGARWTEIFATNGVINTSDENYKQDIKKIDDAVLKAWANIDFCQFKMKHAVKEKGNFARIHFGIIAQKIKVAFEDQGLNPFDYGLLCYDKWDDEFDNDGILVNAAGESYGIRYEEALALECAYLRSIVGRLT